MLSPFERKPAIIPSICLENDNIFISSSWREAWWLQWGSSSGFCALEQCKPEVCRNLYVDSYSWKLILPIRCLQFVGTNYRRYSTPRAEYNCLPVISNELPQALNSTLETRWTEAVFRDVIEGGPFHETVADWANSEGFSVRVLHRDLAYHIDTDSDFNGYLSLLGKNSRLKLFNRRSLLEQQGRVVLESWPLERLDEFFDVLNRFHSLRWGSPCFSSDSCSFHKRFLHGIREAGGIPDLSVLTVDGSVESLLYNVNYRGVCYNLQSGFNEGFHRKIALGTLHLGYCIENACNDPEIRTFDLLAGGGKRSDYKSHLATQKTPLISIMLVRGRFYRWLYGGLDKARAWKSKEINRDAND